MNKPSLIYNVDESGLPLDHRSPYALSKKGQKKVRHIWTEREVPGTTYGLSDSRWSSLK